MAALILHSATCFALSSHRLTFHRRRERPGLLFSAPTLSAPRRFSICCASIRRPRAGKKVMTNVELCNQIKEFLSAVGLPEDHVPSMKELSLHGRKDLANIVRRRGYKLIRELLANSVQTDVSGSHMLKNLADQQAGAAASGKVEKPEGQDQKAEILAEETNLSDEVPLEEHLPDSPDVRPHVTSGEDTNEEPPVILFSDEKSTEFYRDGVINDRTSLVGGATVEENSSDLNVDVEPDFSNTEHVALEISNNLELASDTSSSFTVEVEDLDYSGENASSPSNASNGENYPQDSEYDTGVNTGISIELPDYKTLEEKVTKFMEDGYLDPVAENLPGICDEIGKKELDCVGNPESAKLEKGLEIQQETPTKVQPVHTYGSNDPLTSSTSNSGSFPEKSKYPLGDNHSSGVGQFDACLGKIVDTEIIKGENQAEINRLRYMLHQKQLELSRLKEVIEKEKLALSFLQTKAENEINKAQKLISEKDAELQAAEDSLSGLKEVEIQYCGDGDIVEVAGSFNGWHHRIKMDPQALASSMNGAGSRKSRLWSTMLLLYPGVYEIKFVVDGQWVVDPEKESTTKGSICNNILRVDR